MFKIFIVFILGTILISGKTYYVSPLGNNFNDGTINFPFATIQRAFDTVDPNDSIIVKEGYYPISSGILVRDDSVYLNCVGDVILDGQFTNVNKKFFDFRRHSYVRISGLTLMNISYWGIWIDGNFNEVRNCKVINSKSSGICVIESSYNLVSNNVVHNVGLDNLIGNSITIESRVDVDGNFIPADNNIIEYNKISLNKVHFGINSVVVYDDPLINEQHSMQNNIFRFNQIDSCWTGIYLRQNQNFEIYGNIIAYSDGIAVQNEGHGIKFDFGHQNQIIDAQGKIYNNTIAWCNSMGIYNEAFKNLYIFNNSFYQNNRKRYSGAAYIRFDYIEGVQLSNNAYFGDNLFFSWNYIKMDSLEWRDYETTCVYGDPAFVDAPNDNYYLNYNSALRGTGLNLLDINPLYDNRDILNRSRPSKYNEFNNVWDIGAYEYYGELTNLENNTVSASDYILYNNYPNPFNPATTIKFYIPENSLVKLKIMNILGEVLLEEYNNILEKGEHNFEFNAGTLSSGVYIYNIEFTDMKKGLTNSITRKMVLLK